VFTNQPSEIVVALVGPLGTDNTKVIALVQDRLREYGYAVEAIRISSEIIPALLNIRDEDYQAGSKYERFSRRINCGNKIRKQTDRASLAIAVAADIRRRRIRLDRRSRSRSGGTRDALVTKKAFIVSSLKLPDEVAELRKIYRDGFYLIGVNTERELRLKFLMGSDGTEMTENEAVKLIHRDEGEREDHGQHTRDTFALADFFCADEGNEDKLRHSINRCLDLVFGCPWVTPTFNEFAMFMAFSSSLRSADLSRQVGAVIAKSDTILATGANDCPRPGGGLYWPVFIGDRIDDLPRGRDYKRGEDSNEVERHRIIDRIVALVPEDMRRSLRRALAGGGPIKNITEYGRVVHAEMEALLSCARTGVSAVGGTLYCTTFPCHNCAKHVIASGIREVIYVEPYPKSKALEFHDEAVTTGRREDGDARVRFKPFIGVGPRRFFDLFSMELSVGRSIKRKDKQGRAVRWEAGSATPRVQMLTVSHRAFETSAVKYLVEIRRTKGKKS
jgi:deoxycytidylate deaminase